jgi:hypothetical protein
MEAEERLQEFSDLFESYQQALSDGNWQKAAEIMSELESMLDEMETSNGGNNADTPDNPEGSQAPEDNAESSDNQEE